MWSQAFLVSLIAATSQVNALGTDGNVFKLVISSIRNEAEKFTQRGRDELNKEGPTFTVDVSDLSLPHGVGSLNLEGRFQREIVDNVDVGLVYKYNENRGLPTTVWASTEQDCGDDMIAHLRADFDVESKNAVIDCRVSKGKDSVAVDFDTADNTIGPLRITKHLELNNKNVVVQPTLDIQGQTGKVVIGAELDGDETRAELTLNHSDDSAMLEVSHRIDDDNVISPKLDLKTGDLAVRLNRALGHHRAVSVTGTRENVDFEYFEGPWQVKGNIPLVKHRDSAISFKRSITL